MVGLLDRDAQLTTLRGLFDDAARGSGRLIFVAAEAGAGKSLLVQTFCDSVASRARTLTGWCEPLASPRPAGPLVDMARGLGAEVSSILHDERRPGLFDALYADLAASAQPTLLVFEDVHWADETSLDLLRFLGRRVGTLRALVIATYRDDETGPEHPLRRRLGDLATQSAVSRLDLPPLSLEAVTTLAEGTGQDPREVLNRTAGNAFFVSEVLHAQDGHVPATVRDSVVARSARLTPAARHALTAAAVLGPRAEPSALLEIPGVDALALDECTTAGLLRLTPPVFTFRHELVRQAVLSVTPEPVRRVLSAHALAALRSRSDDHDVLAKLAELAEDAGDGAAVLEFAPAAARRASGLGAHRDAARQYSRALAFSTEQEQRAELLERASTEHYLYGNLPDAVASRVEALALRRGLGQRFRVGDDLRWLGRLHWYNGQRAESERCAAEALEILTPLGPSPELAMAMSVQSQLHMLGSGHAAAIAWGTRAIALAEELDLPEVIAHALNNVGSAQVMGGDESGFDLLRRSLAMSRDLNFEDHVARAYVNLTRNLVLIQRLHENEPVIAEALQYCGHRDLDLQVPYLRATRAQMNAQLGRWDEARDEALETLAILGLAPVHRFVLLLPLVTVNLRSGTEDRAHADELRRVVRTLAENQRTARFAILQAEVAWLSGEPVPADGELATVYRHTLEYGDYRDATELGVWLHRLGLDVQQAPHQSGAFRDAVADPIAAAERLIEAGNRYDAAVLLTDGDESDVRRALEIFNEMGAAPAAAVTAAALRRMGVAGIPRGPRRATRDNPHGLTARQVEVLDLVGERLTNAEIADRLFLSERTVDHHVSAILTKLDVTTREEARRKVGHSGRRS
ncbi:MAG: ATP-binding protein [Actinomycetales bacterium]